MFTVEIQRHQVPVALEPQLSLAVLNAGLCPREPLPEETKVNVRYFTAGKRGHRRCTRFCRVSPWMLPGGSGVRFLPCPCIPAHAPRGGGRAVGFPRAGFGNPGAGDADEV